MVQEDDKPTVILHQVKGFYLSLVVPQRDVKRIKQALEAHGLLDKSQKITPFVRGDDDPLLVPARDIRQINCNLAFDAHNLRDRSPNHAIVNNDRSRYDPPTSLTESQGRKYIIPTTFELDGAVRPDDEIRIAYSRDKVLQRIGFADQPGIEAQLNFPRHSSRRSDESNESLLAQAVRRWLRSLPPHVQSKLPANTDDLLNSCKWTYTIYPPMLLLPPTFLSKDPWPELLANTLEPQLPELYNNICQQLKVTHVAINGPIPALLPNSKSDALESNTLRLPSNLVPLHGDFGKPNLPSVEENFEDAFWVSTTQNDITQAWAPLHTMFSKGNISEKTRLLKLLSVSSAHQSTAVDLYAGIGYFAFSYAKAGIGKVLCWELNGWSIEGLKRGAKTNGWSIKVVDNARKMNMLDDSDQVATDMGEERFLVFHESNANAAERVQGMRHRVPPVRYVNCGYLPSSSDSWDVAVQILDPVEGGWIHAHENVRIRNIEGRKDQIVDIFKHFVQQYRTLGSESSFNVECQQVEQVKAYAPGIIHCVFDIAILPGPASDGIAQA
ncbi:MAG: hypothetical protein Q9211_003422 [Gyalolechia sp. 1 TL-2023]